MIKHNQDGSVNLVASLGFTILLLILSLAFGVWAFASRQDYKNNVDAKVSVAVAQAVINEEVVKNAQFAEQSKYPLATYNGPEQYGSLVVKYPKTWSGYVDDTGTSDDALVDGYFSPGVVPSISDSNSVFALRVQVINESYSQVLQDFSSQEQSGGVTASAYSLPKVPQVVGVELSGQLTGQTNTTMVVLPLRDNTLEIWTEGSSYLNDFNNNILPNFSFSP